MIRKRMNRVCVCVCATAKTKWTFFPCSFSVFFYFRLLVRLWFYILNISLYHSVETPLTTKVPQYSGISYTYSISFLSRFLSLSVLSSLIVFSLFLWLFHLFTISTAEIRKTFPRCCLWNFRKLLSATHKQFHFAKKNFTIAEIYNYTTIPYTHSVCVRERVSERENEDKSYA